MCNVINSKVCLCVFLPILMSNSTNAEQINIEWLTVGSPGNVADGTGFGSVPYTYRISKFEITNDQYVDFLNNVARNEVVGLYQPSMEMDPRGGISRIGTSGEYFYDA